MKNIRGHLNQIHGGPKSIAHKGGKRSYEIDTNIVKLDKAGHGLGLGLGLGQKKTPAIFDANQFGYNHKGPSGDGLFKNEMNFDYLDTEFDSDGFDDKLDGKFQGKGSKGYNFNSAFNVQGLGFFNTGDKLYDQLDDDDDENGDIGGSKFLDFGFGSSW